MKKYSTEIYQSIIRMILQTNLNNREIAEANGVSTSLVECINGCRHTEANKLHSYKQNINGKRHTKCFSIALS